MLSSINYVWRLVGTGFAFAAFFGGGLLLALTVFPLIALIKRDTIDRVRATQAVIHRVFQFFVSMLEFLGIIRVDVRGVATLQGGSGRLIIANHPTLLDVVILMSLIPHAQCIVKAELWRNRYLGGVMRWAGYIRNDLEPEALLDACKVAMAEGKDLIIFPEGTRQLPDTPTDISQAVGFDHVPAAVRLNACSAVIAAGRIGQAVLRRLRHWLGAAAEAIAEVA